MSMVMIRVPRQKTEDLKGMINEGLHILGRAMSLAEEMCEPEAGGYGERGGGYGERMGMRDYPPQYPMMGERDYDPYMGERRGRSSVTGRYTRM